MPQLQELSRDVYMYSFIAIQCGWSGEFALKTALLQYSIYYIVAILDTRASVPLSLHQWFRGAGGELHLKVGVLVTGETPNRAGFGMFDVLTVQYHPALHDQQ